MHTAHKVCRLVLVSKPKLGKQCGEVYFGADEGKKKETGPGS